MAIGPEQKKALYRTKLLSLVRLHFSDFDPDSADFSSTGSLNGATCRQGDRAVALIDGESTAQALGHALVAVRTATSIKVLVDGDAAVISRRAAGFTPIDGVWQVTDKEIAPVVPAKVTVPAADIPFDDPLVELLEAAHVDVLFEDGAVVGEVLGAEVARIMVGHDGEPRLDVGVGQYDQEAFALMNAGLEREEGLAAVCAEVRRYRQLDAEPHPINRLARARWLRSLLMANPEAIGLSRLSPVPSILPRSGIKEEVPTVAIGTDDDGALVGVVCAVGLDLDLVPTAADVVWIYGVERVILVVPPRDRYALVDEMAELLDVPTQIFEATEPWPGGLTP